MEISVVEEIFRDHLQQEEQCVITLTFREQQNTSQETSEIHFFLITKLNLLTQNQISRLCRLGDWVRLISFAVRDEQRLIILTVQDEQLTAADRRLKVSQAYCIIHAIETHGGQEAHGAGKEKCAYLYKKKKKNPKSPGSSPRASPADSSRLCNPINLVEKLTSLPVWCAEKLHVE